MEEEGSSCNCLQLPAPRASGRPPRGAPSSLQVPHFQLAGPHNGCARHAFSPSSAKMMVESSRDPPGNEGRKEWCSPEDTGVCRQGQVVCSLPSWPHCVYADTAPPPPADPGPGPTAFPSEATRPLPASTSDRARGRVGQGLGLGGGAQVPPLSPPAPPHPSLSSLSGETFLPFKCLILIQCLLQSLDKNSSPFPSWRELPCMPPAPNSEPSPHSSQAQHKHRLSGPRLPRNCSS